MKFHFAVYTATHGLEWQYDKNSIDYADLDFCRSAFGALPDFDSGESGFEGVLVYGGRVFVVRCFCAPKWDFMGRDAIYLAVAWCSRGEAHKLNLDELLGKPEFTTPCKEPQFQFEYVPQSDAKAFADLDADGVWRRTIGEKEFKKIGGEKMMPADKALQEINAETKATTAASGKMPAAELLGSASPDVGNQQLPQNTERGCNVGLRILAVVLFFVFLFVGTYFAKVSRESNQIWGYILFAVGVALCQFLWRSGR